MTAIANAGGSTINANTMLSVASVTCSGDISSRDVTATRELHVDGAAVLNSSLTVGGVNVMSAIASKQNALTSSAALSCSTLSASSTVSLSGIPLLRLYVQHRYPGLKH